MAPTHTTPRSRVTYSLALLAALLLTATAWLAPLAGHVLLAGALYLTLTSRTKTRGANRSRRNTAVSGA